MNTINGDLPLVFLGDVHGAWNTLFYILRTKDLKNCSIVCVGDLGVGFSRTESLERGLHQNLNEDFKERNIVFYGIRGNHDDPLYFTEQNKVQLSNFQLIDDYSVYTYNNKTIQFVGGAVSIDRTGRQPGVSFWENEGVVFNREACKHVDILVTHTAPSHCFPQQFNETVYGWARQDAYLIEDLNDERAVVDEIFKLCSPTLHLYGHFHSSWTESINNCKHKLLDINELWEYRDA